MFNLFSCDKKKLLKKLKINYKTEKETLNLKIKGSLNLLNNKINIDFIETDENYKLADKDLKNFKKLFESIIFDEKFFQIFDLSKIRRFISKIL